MTSKLPEDKSLDEMIVELEYAARLENSETGEQWMSLTKAETAARYGSDVFKAAWEHEVREQYEHFTSNFQIVTTKQIVEIEHEHLEFIE